MKCEFFKQVLKQAKQLTNCTVALLLSSCGSTDNSAEKNVLIPVAAGETFVYVNNRGESMKPEINVLETSAFYGDYAVVGKDKKGFINRSGKLIIPMQYAEATIFSDGLAFVKEAANSTVKAINTQGKEVFNLPDAYNARRFSEGLAAFLDNKTRLWGYVNKTGKVVIEPQFQIVGDFSCGLAAVGSKEAFGFIDTKGNMVIDPQFSDALFAYYAKTKFTTDGLCIVGVGGIRSTSFGVINTKGQYVFPQTNCWSIVADKGGFIVNSENMRNLNAVYMDVKGKILLEGFAKIHPFNGGKYTVAIPFGSKEYVIIDRTGKTVVQLDFSPVDFQSSFVDGMAVAQNGITAGDGRSIINEKGERIIDEKRVYVADDYGPDSEFSYFKLNTY